MTKRFLNPALLLTICFALITSCSSDDDNGDPSNGNGDSNNDIIVIMNNSGQPASAEFYSGGSLTMTEQAEDGEELFNQGNINFSNDLQEIIQADSVVIKFNEQRELTFTSDVTDTGSSIFNNEDYQQEGDTYTFTLNPADFERAEFIVRGMLSEDSMDYDLYRGVVSPGRELPSDPGLYTHVIGLFGEDLRVNAQGNFDGRGPIAFILIFNNDPDSIADTTYTISDDLQTGSAAVLYDEDSDGFQVRSGLRYGTLTKSENNGIFDLEIRGRNRGISEVMIDYKGPIQLNEDFLH